MVSLHCSIDHRRLDSFYHNAQPLFWMGDADAGVSYRCVRRRKCLISIFWAANAAENTASTRTSELCLGTPLTACSPPRGPQKTRPFALTPMYLPLNPTAAPKPRNVTIWRGCNFRSKKSSKMCCRKSASKSWTFQSFLKLKLFCCSDEHKTQYVFILMRLETKRAKNQHFKHTH